MRSVSPADISATYVASGRSPARDAKTSEIPMSPRSHLGWKCKTLRKVLVDEYDGIRGAHPRIAGQTSQHRIGLG